MSETLIPPPREAFRRLIVCCDGTWNAADAGRAATNVLRLLRCIPPSADDGTPQIVRYHAGIGTGNRLDRWLGGCVGLGVGPAVRDLYAFLVNNYLPGDEIFLFGFSRGAYTARILGDLIGAIGLLHPREMGRFIQAWQWYELPDAQRDSDALDRGFKLRTKDVPVRCIGVWDTVAAMGVPENGLFKHWQPCADTYRFYDATLGAHIEYAFQALAIDERRALFEPILWQPADPPPVGQTVRQVWFAGVHADIGGGYAENGPADITFIWMLAQLAPLLTLDLLSIPDELDTTEDYGFGTLNESFSGLLKIAGEKRRSVGPGADQYVHETARMRFGYRGYPTNPDFDFEKLPVWPRDAFEQSFAWSKNGPFPSWPPVPGRRQSFCAKALKWLEGS